MAGFTLADKQAQLAEVSAAISAIMNGAQSYRLGDRQVSRADLATLEMREKRLERDVARLAGSRPRVSSAVLSGN